MGRLNRRTVDVSSKDVIANHLEQRSLGLAHTLVSGKFMGMGFLVPIMGLLYAFAAIAFFVFLLVLLNRFVQAHQRCAMAIFRF
jgi:uncharacterized membrane protein